MHLGMAKCHIPFSSHCDLDLLPSFNNYSTQSISIIFFVVGIPNLVRICILGWPSVTYHLQVSETLTSDLVVIISVSGAYLLYLLRKGIPNWCVHGCNLGWWSVLYHLRVTVTLSSDIV